MNLKSEGYLHAITLFALFSLFHPLSALQNVTLLFLGRKLARDAYTSTSAVTLINVCRAVNKYLLWCRQTFAMVFSKFCRGVHKHLPQVHSFFVTLTKFYFRAFKSKSACVK